MELLVSFAEVAETCAIVRYDLDGKRFTQVGCVLYLFCAFHVHMVNVDCDG